MHNLVRRLAPALGLCEIHSNALMFGGIASTGFKIKWKHIDKQGKRMLSRIKEICAGPRD